MTKSNYPTQVELQEVFELRVDFRNGHETLWRKVHPSKWTRDGKEKRVDCKVNHSDGYCQVNFKGRMIKYHTIVWILSNGEIPEGLVVLHKDSHSKLCNQSGDLRIGPQRKNCQELQIHIDGKLCGCTYNKQRKGWVAKIVINDKQISLGFYDTEKEANAIYNKADKMRIDGFSPNFIQKMLRVKTKDKCTSKYKGVSFYRVRGKWVTQITIEGKRIHLGYYDSEEESSQVYLKAKKLKDQFVDVDQFRKLLL